MQGPDPMAHRLALPTAAALALVLATLPAPAAAAEDDLQVTLGERRAGDVYQVHVDEKSQFLWGGDVITFEDEEEQTHTLSLRELPLSWADRRQVLYVNVTTPAGDIFPDFRKPQAYALSTGEALLDPFFSIAGVSTGVLTVAGSLEFRSQFRDIGAYTEIQHQPATRLQEIVDGETLTVGTEITEVVDHRPRFDRVERFHLNVTGTDTIEGTPTLQAQLTTERLQDGDWTEAGIPLTLWLADGAPVPLRVQTEVEEPPFRYELTQNQTVAERGDEVVPWGSGEAPRLDGPAQPYEKGPLSADGPTDGDAVDHPFPLSEAVKWARLLPTADGYQRWRLQHPDAVLVRASFQTAEDDTGTVHHGWNLQYADEEDSEGVQVTRHVPDEPASEAAFHTSDDWSTWPTTFPTDLVDGQQALTVAQMSALQDPYALQDETDRLLAFDLYVHEGDLEMDVVLESANVTEEGTPYLDESSRIELRATLLEGRTGEARLHGFYEGWGSTNTTLDPQTPAASADDPVPGWVPPIR